MSPYHRSPLVMNSTQFPLNMETDESWSCNQLGGRYNTLGYCYLATSDKQNDFPNRRSVSVLSVARRGWSIAVFLTEKVCNISEFCQRVAEAFV